jgi:hypothetical protein
VIVHLICNRYHTTTPRAIKPPPSHRSRQHTMQQLLLQCCGCCLSPAGAHRSSHPSTTIHCINSRQYKVDATSNRPTVRSYHKHTQCCPPAAAAASHYQTNAQDKLQRTVSSTTMDHVNWQWSYNRRSKSLPWCDCGGISTQWDH